MAKPVIWRVDDDPDVLPAVKRDLRRHYGDRYKVNRRRGFVIADCCLPGRIVPGQPIDR